MSDLLSRFERFAKRRATDVERARLLENQKHLRISDDDAVWDLMFALDLYDGYFRQTPTVVRRECKGVIEDASRAIKASMDRAAEATGSRLQDQVDRLEAAARTLAAMQANIMGILILALAASVFLAFVSAWLFHAQGCRAEGLSDATSGITLAPAGQGLDGSHLAIPDGRRLAEFAHPDDEGAPRRVGGARPHVFPDPGHALLDRRRASAVLSATRSRPKDNALSPTVRGEIATG